MINIDDLIGVKYRKNGRTKEEGFDCYGLAIEVLKRFGHNLPDIENARKDDYDFNECHQLILKRVKVKEIPEPQEAGDVVLIKKIGKAMTHIGVYMGNGQVIHCNAGGVHIEKLSRLNGMIGRCYKWL